MHYNFQFKNINGGGLAQLQQLADTILAKVAYRYCTSSRGFMPRALQIFVGVVFLYYFVLFL